MAVKDLPSSKSPYEELADKALEVLAAHVAALPPADLQDLVTLAKELRRPDAAEDERIAAQQAILEILRLKNHGGTVVSNREIERAPALERWVAHVAKAVKTLRAGQRMTQADLAVRSGLTQSHISRIETATMSPSSATINKIAAALGVDPGRIDPTRD